MTPGSEAACPLRLQPHVPLEETEPLCKPQMFHLRRFTLPRETHLLCPDYQLGPFLDILSLCPSQKGKQWTKTMDPQRFRQCQAGCEPQAQWCSSVWSMVIGLLSEGETSEGLSSLDLGQELNGGVWEKVAETRLC